MAELSTTISVFVERVVQASCLTDVMELVHRHRIQAMMSPGYQLGVIWQDISNPNRILTIDHWQSIERWEGFRVAPDGLEILQNIEPFLAEPSTVRLYVNTRGNFESH